jgi:hypothetical protein
MPGTNNTPRTMLFEASNQPAPGVTTPVNWWRAEGIPISPYDDAHVKNPYPLMRLVAHDAANNEVAASAIVLPVSDEMDCRACHASGTQTAARPAAGWVSDPNPEREYRLNIRCFTMNANWRYTRRSTRLRWLPVGSTRWAFTPTSSPTADRCSARPAIPRKRWEQPAMEAFRR